MKKALSITALCLIAVLALTVIILSFVNKSFNPNLTSPDYIEVYVNQSSGAESYDKDDENAERKAVYDKVMELYSKGFNQRVMGALFQGNLFDDVEISRSGINLDNTLKNGVFVAFNYEDEQTLKLNGKDYVYNNGSYKDQNIKYNTLYVEVKDTDSMSDITIYVKSITSTSNYSYYRYTVKAKQADLYKYIQENFV